MHPHRVKGSLIIPRHCSTFLGLEYRGCDIADFVHKSFVHKISNPHTLPASLPFCFVADMLCISKERSVAYMLCILTRTLLSLLNAVALQTKKTTIRRLPSGELAGARTQDPNIKSVVLYLLSYEFIVPNRFWWCKDRTFFSNAKIKCIFLSSRALISKLRAYSTRKIANVTY